MRKLRCRIICFITLVVVTFGSILNPALSLRAQATGVVEGGLLIELLIDLAVSCGILYVGHEAVESFDRDTFENELLSYCCTPEGYNALLDIEIKEATKEEMQSVRDRFRAEYMPGGSNQSPDPKKVEEILKITAAGISVGTALLFLKHFYADRTSSSSGSAIGAAINEASSQQVTVISPLPEYMHIASVSNRIYADYMDYLIMQTYPEYSMLNSYYVQFVNGGFYSNIVIDQEIHNISADSFWLEETSPNAGGFRFYALDSVGNKLNILIRYYAFANHVYKMQYDEFGVGSDISDIYLYGNIFISLNNGELYHVYPDGSVEQLFDDAPAEKVKFSISTAEGYLTSVKPVVNMDISSLVDAIGQAIADAHPDEVPSLSPEAVAAILAGVAGVYDDAVTNYYNDTSYIDQSQYITNITNVYEQAIADDPVIDLPATDTGVLSAIKAIPGQIANVLKDIFVPDIALYSFYFLDIKSKFAFADNFLDYGSNLITILFDSDPEIPKIVIDFGLAESKYNYGGRTYALDMTFYDRFKPLVDNIIVSFSWLAFGYWMYKNLPEIISGAILSRKDYAVVKETANTVFSRGGTFGSFSKERVKEIRDIDKIKIEKNNKK